MNRFLHFLRYWGFWGLSSTPDPAAPTFNGNVPTITGTPEVGFTLSAVPATGTDRGYPTAARTWRWRAETAVDSGVFEDIVGATAQTFDPLAEHVGKLIRVVEQLQNNSGLVTSTSASTAAIIAANSAPVAVDDPGLTTPFETAHVFTIASILANDTDVDLDTLTLLSYTQPSDGTVSDDGTSFTYTPDDAHEGADSFDYVVQDGRGGTDTGTVTVTTAAPTYPAIIDARTSVTGFSVVLEIDVDAYGPLDANEIDINIDGTPVTPSSTAVDPGGDRFLVLSLAAAIEDTDTVTITVRAGSGLLNVEGRELLPVTALAVTNLVAPPVATLVLTSLTQAAANDDVAAGFTTDFTSDAEVIVYLSSLGSPDVADFDTGVTDLNGYYDLGVVTFTALAEDIELELPDGLDGDYRLAVLPTGGNSSNISESPVETLNTVPVPAYSVTLLPVQANSQTISTINYTVDLSAWPAGGTLVLAYGHNQYPTDVRYEGVSTTSVAEGTNAANSGQRISTYTHVFAAGAADDVISVDQGTTNANLLGAFVMVGASIVDIDMDWNQNGSSMAATVVTTDASNRIIAFGTGNAQTDGLTNWVGATEDTTDSVSQGDVASAENTDVAVGSHTVSVDPVVSSGRMSLIVFAVEPD